jgi:hypothetical protein
VDEYGDARGRGIERVRRCRETLEALGRVDLRNNPTAEDIAHLHEVHAQHEAEMGRPERAAAAKERADRSRRLSRQGRGHVTTAETKRRLFASDPP